LVDFHVADGPEIKATYEVDNISPNQNACVLITQDYQFSPPVYPGTDKTAQGCEPSASLACARFIPLVTYQFIAGDETETLTHINTAQRIHFAVDTPSSNVVPAWPQTSLFIADLDPQGIPVVLVGPFVVVSAVGPVRLSAAEQNEVVTDAVIGGRQGFADNYHQTSQIGVKLPGPGPGCAECAHIHWRWFSFAGERFGSGLPLVNGSNNPCRLPPPFNPFEEDPQPDFRTLVNGNL
jgi:hypothetical protein